MMDANVLTELIRMLATLAAVIVPTLAAMRLAERRNNWRGI